MSHCCKEIYWACYQHRKSQSLGANGRCFAYCGIFSYCALSLLMHTQLHCSLSSHLPVSPVTSSFCWPRQGLLRAQSTRTSLKSALCLGAGVHKPSRAPGVAEC